MYSKIIIVILIAYITIACNSNIVVKRGNRVALFYKIENIDSIRLDESSVIDNFRDKSNVFAFNVGNGEVIEGWDSVIIGCKKNKLYSFEIPYQQAYGEEEIYHDIPAKSNLLLTFKIIKIE
ncbi:MAG: FKBP-type peptidyl-prolyl cis-trans isomerase [Ignavibacteriales bacterium]|nr:FKBP-type peptidyl-prolyl cis-trans isomerase [Ignavibacteriales bacterium]